MVRRYAVLALLMIVLLAGAAVSEDVTPKAALEGGNATNLGVLGAIGRVSDEQIEIVSLFDRGAGVKQLKVGDVITGVDGASFEGDPRRALGNAIDNAESRDRRGLLKLQVKRGDKESEVTIKLPVIGAFGETYPDSDKKADAIVAAFCKLLADEQQGDGTWPLAGPNREGYVVVSAVCGLALLASGESRYAKNLKKAVDYVKTYAGKGPETNIKRHTNWTLALGGHFLAEYYLSTKDRSLVANLEAVAKQLVKQQESGGGWAHDPGYQAAAGYVEFAALTSYALLALALIEKCGVEIDNKSFERGQDFVEKCIRSNGFVDYAPDRGDGICNLGPTGACVAAYTLKGNRPEPLQRMIKGLEALYAEASTVGHGSGVLGMMYASCGCAMSSRSTDSKVLRLFMDDHKWYWTLARKFGGGFVSQASEFTRQVGHNPDQRQLGDFWASGCLGAALLMGRGKLAMCGAGLESDKEKKGK